ncbi:MAG: addiction module protein [Thermoanaerobaculia bacterium]|nr:addiction module protein [Thermoanaerobaculia bacterium]
MSSVLDIESMSVEDKLRLIESVWNDLSRNAEAVPVPDWHLTELQERERRLQDGRSTLSDWSDVRRRLRDAVG